MNITTEHSLGYTFLCLIVAALLTFLLYRKSKIFEEITQPWKIVLSAARFLLLFMLCFLLLNPLLVYIQKTVEKPVLVFAQDVSASLMFTKDTGYLKNEYLQNIEQKLQALSEDFEIQRYEFGGEVSSVENIKNDFSAKTTDLSALFERIETDYVNRNLGAVVVATDGNYNQGFNPEYGIANVTVPVYTIAIGDSISQKDLLISGVWVNNIAYLGNEFPIEVSVESHGYQGEYADIKIYGNGKLLAVDTMTINKADFYTKKVFYLEAKLAGIQGCKVELTRLENEKTYDNNSEQVYIDVVNGTEKVLILTNAAHPDIKAIRYAIESNKNYSVEVSFLKEFTGAVKGYSLIVLNQLPAAGNGAASILKEALENKISVLYIVGTQANIAGLNGLNLGVKIKNSRKNTNLVGSIVNGDFKLFKVPGKLKEYVSDMPPIVAPFGNYKVSDKFYSMIYQRIGDIQTHAPLMGFNKMSNGQKIGFIFGEGIWRWRLYLFNRTESHLLFDQLITKMVQYLSIEDDKRKFRITSNNIYNENEAVVIKAELYNNNYDLVNAPDVRLKLKDIESDLSYDYVFSKDDNGYHLRIAALPAGEYQFIAETEYNGELYSENGAIKVKKINIESLETGANYQLLANIANKTGGKMVKTRNAGQVFNEIAQSNKIVPVFYYDESFADVITLSWLFFVLLALVSIEWFVRKRSGSY